VFTPDGGGNGGALLYMHGGGMVIGTAAQEDAHLAQIAAEMNIVTVSVEYRLAPEHPFPAPLDDCFAAWIWLVSQSLDRGIDPSRIVVGGQSAGGGLAAGLVQRIHDHGGPQPVGQWLFCPMLDDRTAARRDLDSVKHFLWNNRSNLIGWTAYLNTSPGADSLPAYASPARRSDLSGLPPTWIGSGDIELFFDENVAYAEALRIAGVECVLDAVPGAPHAFESVAANTQLAKDYTARAEAWLRGRLER
jgi:acetyl esterase/lipase